MFYFCYVLSISIQLSNIIIYSWLHNLTWSEPWNFKFITLSVPFQFFFLYTNSEITKKILNYFLQTITEAPVFELIHYCWSCYIGGRSAAVRNPTYTEQRLKDAVQKALLKRKTSRRGQPETWEWPPSANTGMPSFMYSWNYREMRPLRLSISNDYLKDFVLICCISEII